jgi:hypothetical protein
MDIDKLKKEYEYKVKNIDLNLKKKYFIPNIKLNPSSINISSFDDMFYEMYYKQKYFTNLFNNNNLNLDVKVSGNIINDLKVLLKRFDRLFLHDTNFKISLYNQEKNYFTPTNENEIFLYNSLDNETYQQSEFRKQLWYIEDIIKEKILPYYKNYNININFFDDDKYNMMWIIFKIIKQNN